MSLRPMFRLGDNDDDDNTNAVSGLSLLKSTTVKHGPPVSVVPEFSTPDQFPMRAPPTLVLTSSTVTLPAAAHATTVANRDFSRSIRQQPVVRRHARKSAHPYRSLLACDLLAFSGFAPRKEIRADQLDMVMRAEAAAAAAAASASSASASLSMSSAAAAAVAAAAAKKSKKRQQPSRSQKRRRAPVLVEASARTLRRRKLSDEVSISGVEDDRFDDDDDDNDDDSEEADVFNDDDHDDDDGTSAVEQKRQRAPPQSRPRASRKKTGGGGGSGTAARKECASCGVRNTPYWRDGWDNVSLCNACGIRYKKRKIACNSCNYVPRKEESYGVCPQCEVGEFL